jgi:hypothetical protein
LVITNNLYNFAPRNLNIADMKVVCIEKLQTKKLTFEVGKEYNSSKVNDTWWLVDSVAVNANDFEKYFRESDA